MENGTGIRLDGLKVLIVDDAPDNRLLVTRFLALAGAKTDAAADGAQGIVCALSEDFDVILMDIQMPGMDGYEAVYRLRSHHYAKPIIALTAHAMKSERDKCMSSGFDAYLTKPISRSDLLIKIREVCDRADAQLKEPNPPASILPDPDERPAPREEHQSQDHIQH